MLPSPAVPALLVRHRGHALLACTLVLSSAAALAILAARMGYSGTAGYAFMVWNLFLAWIPLWLAAAVALLDSRRGSGTGTGNRSRVPLLLGLALLWLLFFPNAPYLVTQFMHLHPSHAVHDAAHPLAAWTVRGPIPIWFDVLMLSTFAWTGLMLGFVSLHLVHRTAARIAGTGCGWAAVVAATGLCAFGVSLGRFQRWNSWDLFARPLSLLADVADRALNPLAHPRTTAATLGFAAFLLLGYLTLLAIMRMSAAEKAGE